MRLDGDVSQVNGWSAAYLICQPGFEVAGSKSAYCDGSNWDQELGKCRETQIGPQLWCDFENESICDWVMIKSSDFVWKRFNGVERLYGLEHSKGFSGLRSGPKHDHTTNQTAGFFMMAQSKIWNANGLTHLMSPLYPVAQSVDACFRFYFYMYGRQMGRLRVYLKPEFIDMNELVGDNKYLLPLFIQFYYLTQSLPFPDILYSRELATMKMHGKKKLSR